MKTFGLIKIMDTYLDSKIPVGTKIWLGKQTKPFTVKASNRFFSICTKPYNPQKTVLYTIIDWHHQVNSTENLVFGFGAETTEECEEMLQRLTDGKSNLSHRKIVKLNIVKFVTK